jgi:hypothetical protein
MPDLKARARAFWTELFNAHDLRNIRGFLAPGFVNRNARPGTPNGPEGAGQVFSLWGFRTRPLVLTWALCGSLVFADEAAEDMTSLDSFLGEVGGRVVGPGRME